MNVQLTSLTSGQMVFSSAAFNFILSVQTCHTDWTQVRTNSFLSFLITLIPVFLRTTWTRINHSLSEIS